MRSLLVDELSIMKQRERSDTEPLNVIPKDMIREILGRSTDVADVFMMRMYFTLRKPSSIIVSRTAFNITRPHVPRKISQNL